MTATGLSPGPLRSLHIGAGGRGQTHVRNFCDHPTWQPTALVDTSPSALEASARLASLDQAACFDDVTAALRIADADAAVVVSPSRFHYEHVRLALEAGLHVFVEKPFAHHVGEAAELVRLADEKGLRITVCQQYRYRDEARTIREAITSGRVGEPRYGTLTHHRHRPDVRAFTMPHAMIVEMSIHHFDDLRAWIGTDADTIVARSFDPPWSSYAGGAVSALVSFAGGAEIAYLGTFTSHADQFELRLECDNGVVGWDSGGVYTTIDGHRTTLPVGQHTSADQRVIDTFTSAILDGRDSPVSGRSNLGTLAMVEAAVHSAETGLPSTCTDVGFLVEGSSASVDVPGMYRNYCDKHEEVNRR